MQRGKNRRKHQRACTANFCINYASDLYQREGGVGVHRKKPLVIFQEGQDSDRASVTTDAYSECCGKVGYRNHIMLNFFATHGGPRSYY